MCSIFHPQEVLTKPKAILVVKIKGTCVCLGDGAL